MSRTADVVVIGSGAVGASVAFYLAGRGARITLLDASTPGRATSASAGGLWPLGESLGLGCGVIFHAARKSGDAAVPSESEGPEPLPGKFMDFLCESNGLFPALAAELRSLSGVDIEAESGTGLLYLLYDEEQQRHARRIVDLVGDDRTRVEEWSAEQVWKRDPLITRDLRGAVYFPGDNQVNPMLLAEGLKRGACAKGGRFVAEARVTGLQIAGERVVAVESSRGTFECGAVVNAAGAWAGQIARLAGIEIPVHPVRGQIVCTETLRPGTLRSNLSTRDCYILQKTHGEVIIGSTTERCDFDVSVRYENLRDLAAGAVRAVPALRDVTVKRTWAGLRPGVPDELPILGRAAEIPNFFHATGGFRTGIVAAPLTGQLVAAEVLGESLPFPIDMFLASRFQKSATGSVPSAHA
ncbi:MAG: hydrogen cyanide synthase [Planctomycetota bacterium]|nr:MAG: hydrogen cyanide synthase [Planctomycetota bacterium]